MTDPDQYQRALEVAREHRRSASRAARMPWWVYAAVFVVVGGAAFAASALERGEAGLSAVIVLALFLVVFGLAVASRVAPLDRLRTVRRRARFEPVAFLVISVLGAAGLWIATRFGAAITNAVAGAVGLQAHSGIVAGVLAGAAFTALFALGRGLSALAGRHTW